VILINFVRIKFQEAIEELVDHCLRWDGARPLNFKSSIIFSAVQTLTFQQYTYAFVGSTHEYYGRTLIPLGRKKKGLENTQINFGGNTNNGYQGST
jgi:hypothetical protein